MQISHGPGSTERGPAEWFTGEVWLDPIIANSPPSRPRALSVHFAPGARTAWDRHPVRQVICVTEGAALVQRRGGPIEAVRVGDTVHFEPDEEHWHGAAPDRFMTHLAILEVDDDGNAATWGDHVSNEEYSAAPTT